MKHIRLITLSLLAIISLSAKAQKPMGEIIEESLSLCRSQANIMAKELEGQECRLPRTFENGELVTDDYR